MEFRQGDIFFYEPPAEQAAPLFVASGSEQKGFRPWVVVSVEAVHAQTPTVVAVPLSTKTNKANSYRINLPASELIAAPGRAPFVNSVALCDHVRVIEKQQLTVKAGRLSENAILAVGLGLAYVFDLR